MIGYKDMTFCSFWESCKDGKKCFRALTKEVQENAEKWWGSKEVPICQYVDKPDCHTTIMVVTIMSRDCGHMHTNCGRR